ncbi:hypothetical protein GA707_07350 [Nostocoides sp. F2B08]|uniref:hypothetical protein n=1 Tax=Nostocoides sp. F2B08 TaxID=2653936 RepID=UPI0012639758|nr:hypothetical protein [Tetrasphaera sp. F2B08]KAB7745709.1 hypothetical protein GA707_07350 [Tetrasphaera sp. F2B08]
MSLRNRMRRPLVVGAAALTAIGLGAAPAMAHQCVNASKKNQAAGVQIVMDATFTPIWISNGLQQRIDKGVVDLATGEGFHGLLGIDLDGDGAVDVATYMVGRDGEIPQKAQWNGPTCKGIVNFETFMTECQTAPV